MYINIQWWESAGDKSPPLSLLSKPHHGGILTGGNMLGNHDHHHHDYDHHQYHSHPHHQDQGLQPVWIESKDVEVDCIMVAAVQVTA